MDLDSLRTRREQRRRELARRRRTAGGVAVLALAATAAVIGLLAGVGGGRSARTRSRARTASRATGQRARGNRGAASSSGGGGSSSGAAWPGWVKASTLGAPGEQPVPVLMYHVIAAPPPGAPFPGLYVTREQFAAQMHALAAAGWHGVTQDQLWAYWHGRASFGTGKPIVITFDNGYQSQFTSALPVLRRLAWPAVENLQLTGLPPSQGGLGQEEIRGLVRAGWELDTQGFSHADLIALDAAALQHEVADSRAEMQRRYGVPVNWFCYPSGHYDATVIAAVRAAGYRGSTTVVPGWANRAEDPYRMHRLRVLGGTGAGELLAQITAIRDDATAPASYSGG